MSIDALVSGTLHRAPQTRTSAAGKPFATAVVRAAMRDGSTTFANVICFDAAACTALLALEAGDSVAMSGELVAKVYQPKDGGDPRPSLDLLVHAVISPYSVTRKRRPQGASTSESPLPFDDPLPPA